MEFMPNIFLLVPLHDLAFSVSCLSHVSVLTPEATHTGTSGYVNRCLGGPTPGLASLERPQQVPQR